MVMQKSVAILLLLITFSKSRGNNKSNISLCKSKTPSSFTVLISKYRVLAHGLEINGSSPTGHCPGARIVMVGGDGVQFQCKQPTASVLFDGHIPTLTELDNSMWARQESKPLCCLPKTSILQPMSPSAPVTL